MNDSLKTILARDPVAEAEKLLGPIPRNPEQCPLDKALAFLQIATSVNRDKREGLKAANDTHFDSTLSEYQSIVEELRFKLVLDLPFEDEYDGPIQEHLFVYFREDGVLLVFDTYGGKSVNGGKFLYNWRPNNRDKIRHGVLSSHSWQDGICVGDHDCREGLRYYLARLEAEGKFVNPWISQPFLWFLHYMDTRIEDYNYRTINETRIAMLPEYVQACICRKE